MPANIPNTCTSNKRAAAKWTKALREGRPMRVSGKTIATAITLGLVREVVESETVPGYAPGTTREITSRRYEVV